MKSDKDLLDLLRFIFFESVIGRNANFGVKAQRNICRRSRNQGAKQLWY